MDSHIYNRVLLWSSSRGIMRHVRITWLGTLPKFAGLHESLESAELCAFLYRCQDSFWMGGCVKIVTDEVKKVTEIEVLKPKMRVWGHWGTSEAHLEPQGPLKGSSEENSPSHPGQNGSQNGSQNVSVLPKVVPRGRQSGKKVVLEVSIDVDPTFWLENQGHRVEIIWFLGRWICLKHSK